MSGKFRKINNSAMSNAPGDKIYIQKAKAFTYTKKKKEQQRRKSIERIMKGQDSVYKSDNKEVKHC